MYGEKGALVSAGRGPRSKSPSAPPGGHQPTATILTAPPTGCTRAPGLHLEAAPERPVLIPTPSNSHTAGALGRRRGSICGASKTAGLAVGTEDKWAKPSTAHRRRQKKLCHAERRAVLHQVSPSVTQLFRAAFLGSCHITRLMSALRSVINSPARLRGDWGATPLAHPVERDRPVPS